LPQYDFQSPRLYVTGALKAGAELTLEKPQAHYLRNVLRLKAGDGVLAFNGKDGEWQATLADGKRPVVFAVDVASGKVLRRLPAGKNGDGLAIAPQP